MKTIMTTAKLNMAMAQGAMPGFVMHAMHAMQAMCGMAVMNMKESHYY